MLFSGTNSLTFDLQGTGTIANGTQYTLMTTTASGGGVGGSVFQGITLSGRVITSGFNLNFVNGTSSYGGSHLILVADGSGYDIDLVAAVPEPGTWGLVLGGLILIGVLLRKRRCKNV